MALLGDVERSGKPLADWARDAGVDGRSLRAWRTNLNRKGKAAARPGPVRLVELVSEPTQPCRYRVMCGDYVIQIDANFEPDVLRRLLEVVASC